MSKKEDDILLERIANHLIIQTSVMDDIGLYYGKMGIVLFFAHYARYTGCSVYEDFADELLGEVIENISDELPINMRTGLCGIGWGIEYLIQNHFMEGDSDEILGELDEKIIERDLRRVKDLSFDTGLEGISCYIRMRLKSPRKNPMNLPFSPLYLEEWNAGVSSSQISDKQLLLSISNPVPQFVDFSTLKSYLKGGYAGYGINYIVNQD